MNKAPFDSLWVYGTGLIGGSAAAAIRARFPEMPVTGAGRCEENLALAMRRGLITRTAPADQWPDADFVLVAAPPLATLEILCRLRLGGYQGIVTDASSIKTFLHEEAADPLWGGRFVPAHPIAGTEYSGAGAAFAELFENRMVILTPTLEENVAASEVVQTFWELCGGRTVRMEDQQHDHLYAAVSHMPHLLMYLLAETLFAEHPVDQLARHSGGGLRGLLRIAASNPVMWSEVFAANAEEISACLQTLRSKINEAETMLLNATPESLQQRLAPVVQEVIRFRTLAGDNR